MPKLVLEFHAHKLIRPDEGSDLVALFLFSLSPAGRREAGIPLDRDHAFWTQVKLSKELTVRGRWVDMPNHDKVRCMFRWAQEKIRERGDKLREASMFWTSSSPFLDGPPWDPNTIVFPSAEPLVFETTQDHQLADDEAKRAAGHLK